jgi:2-desacetyl-2-hydroxyethyl bacteriochlorophyllide A dehydrogenase
MKALVLSAPKKISLETLPDPTPGPDDAVVQVEYAGICGTDVELFINDLLHYKAGYAKLPIVPGHEWSGTVVAVGSNVKHLKSGDRVIAQVHIGCGTCRFCKADRANVCRDRREVGIINQNGGFAQFAKVPATNLHKSADLPFDHSVLSEPTAVVLNACKLARIAHPDNVLIIGAGPIGLLAVQCAKAVGAATVTVIDRSAERLKLAQSLGADTLWNSADFKSEEVIERGQAITDGYGFDVVMECAGAGSIFPHLIPAMARLGRLVVVGCFSEQRPAINPDHLIQGERMLIGAIGGGNSYGDAVKLIAEGKIKAPVLVTHRVPLAEGPALLANLAERKGPAGALKIVLRP